MKGAFLKAGHLPTLGACFLYFDLSFAVWVLLGPLAVFIASDLHLDYGEKGLMVAIPVLAGAALRLVNGILVGQWNARRPAILMPSFLPIYFHDQYQLSPATAGYFTAACVFVGSLARPFGGALADRIGGTRALTFIYALVAIVLLAVANGGLPSFGALGVLMIGMAALGMGNGAVFQLVPQRFGRDVGLMTGIVGMTGGVGGFYLAASLGYAKQFTGSYALGFELFAACAMAAWGGVAAVRLRWRQDPALLAGARV